MPNQVIKRNGQIVEFDPQRITTAIEKAMQSGVGKVNSKLAQRIAEEIEKELTDTANLDNILPDTVNPFCVPISMIEQMVYRKLISHKYPQVAKCYESYRAVREYQRSKNTIDQKVFDVVRGTDTNIKDNSNKNTALISTMRDLVAEEVSKDITLRMLIPPKIASAHNEGLIYIHDMGHYLNPSFNCCLVNLENMLQNGTVINGKLVTKPHTFRTACTIATQIIAQIASGQFGGQTINLAHLSPFVRDSRNRIQAEVIEEMQENDIDANFQQINAIVDRRLQKEIKDGIQTFQYQINTLQSSNGQAPFLSVLMYIDENPEYETETAMLIEEMLHQRIKGMQNETGAWITPAFPKLLYVTDENNITENSKYFYLTKLAAECVAKRMMPDFLSAKILKENYGGVIAPMGCRAFLSPYKGEINNPKPGQLKWWGRFNMGLTSINLADAGLSANKSIQDFWDILDERLELCHQSLRLRYKKLENVTSDVSPIHWQYGGIARLPKHAPIKPLLQDGYATISLGYVGLYECVMALIGKSHTTPEGEKLAVAIMKRLRKAVDTWKKEEGLGYALYGTPAESLTYRFAELTRKRWGVVEGITDRDFLTNSYHVFVEEPINAFDKLKFESQFHSISSGGAISYIELPNMGKNIPAVLQLIQYMYNNVQYAEFNMKLDYCMECGFEGEILCDDDDVTWRCPNCGNTDQTRMNVVRRTCGYLGENYWNKGRTQEITHRVTHL